KPIAGSAILKSNSGRQNDPRCSNRCSRAQRVTLERSGRRRRPRICREWTQARPRTRALPRSHYARKRDAQRPLRALSLVNNAAGNSAFLLGVVRRVRARARGRLLARGVHPHGRALAFLTEAFLVDIIR